MGSFRSFRFSFLPTRPSDTPFRGKDCRESSFASGSRLALHAEARVEEIKGGSVGVFELIQRDRARTHTEPKSADSEAHGIPWLEHKISNHGYPTRYKVRGIVCGGG